MGEPFNGGNHPRLSGTDQVTAATSDADSFNGTRRVSEIDLNQILRESLAQWTRADFLFLESRPWWAPSVQAELARNATTKPHARFGSPASEAGRTPEYFCHSTVTTRSIHEQIQSGSVTGVVLIVEHQLRDCLLLLGRLSRLGRDHPPVLLVIPDNVVAMMPLLLEAGAATVMVQAKVSDITIADWCRRVTASSDPNVRR
ncbi:MAG: hypothetical protein ABGZ17_14880 [Planctomycetaceae bacterium]